MKVIKIKIKQEEIDIDSHCYKEAIYLNASDEVIPVGEIPEGHIVKSECINYEVREAVDYERSEKIRYLVKVSDNKIFDDLLKIGDDDINSKILKKVEEKILQIEHEAERKEKARLENNPLWRRIFKHYK